MSDDGITNTLKRACAFGYIPEAHRGGVPLSWDLRPITGIVVRKRTLAPFGQPLPL
jgi:hypothetical protein